MSEIKGGRRAKVYKNLGLWWTLSYQIHLNGNIRVIANNAFSTHEAARRSAVNAVGLLHPHIGV